MRTIAPLLTVLVSFSVFAADPEPWATKDLRAGIIGTDTSHVPAFTASFAKHPEWRVKVVAAFKGGSPDLPTSANRVENFAKTIQEKNGVEIVDSIEALLARVDVVLLESVDGRPHLAQVTPVFKAGKPVFIDKPLAASFADAKEIVRLSKESGTPFFSCSSFRFHPDIPRLREEAAKAMKVQASSPFNKLEFHPDLYFYGIHGIEALYAVMGPGCVSVTRTADASADITTGKWKDGRTGIYYGPIKGEKAPMIRIWKEGGAIDSKGSAGYDGLVKAIAEFFHTRKPPIDPSETLELFQFMSAAQISMEKKGAPVLLNDVEK